jgi:hypothetical protein
MAEIIILKSTPAQIKANAKYREKHKAKIAEKARLYYQKNKEQLKIYRNNQYRKEKEKRIKQIEIE